MLASNLVKILNTNVGDNKTLETMMKAIKTVAIDIEVIAVHFLILCAKTLPHFMII